MDILDTSKRHMAVHSLRLSHGVGPGTYSKMPKDFEQVLAVFDLVRHISRATGLREPPVVSNFQERFKLKVSASIGYDGVGARCGNGLFSTYKSPKFYLSFTRIE